MCSVGFNGQFGMNIKNYQQLSQMRFGTGVRGAGLNQSFNYDTGIFTAGKPNLFASNRTSSLSFNGVQYDNKYAMLNTVGNNDKDAGADKSFKEIMKDIGSVLKEAFNVFGDEIKSGFNSVVKFVKGLFGGGKSEGANNNSNVGKQSLNDIQNAKDKQALNQALDSANQDNEKIQQNVQGDTNALKTSQNQEAQAQQGADSAQNGLNEANSGLSQAQQDLSAAQTEVQNAEQGLQAAKGNVATAQQALDAAQAAATAENPNDAAIKQAESQLAKAQQEEQAAQQKLDAAKQKETQAQEAVANAEQQVQTAEQNNTEAQEGLNQASENVEASETQLQSTEASGQEISEGIADGEERMQEMELHYDEQVNGTDTEPPRVNEELTAQIDEQVYGTDAEPQTVERDNKFATQDELIDSKGYTEDQKAEILKARQDIQNMQPGQTVQCGADTYTMDENGTIHVNDTAGEYKNKDDAAMNAGDSAMRGIDARNQADAELAALQAGRGSKGKPSVSNNSKPAAADTPKEAPKDAPAEAPKDTPQAAEAEATKEAKDAPETEDKPVKDLDNSKPGTKWRGKRVGAGSREDVRLERNEDGTITETGISGKRILDADGKKVLYQEGKMLGYRGGYGAIDYRNGTETTDIDSIKTGATTGYTIISGMSKQGSDGEIQDKDGNLVMKMKDGEFFNAKGKKIKTGKAIDLINDNKGEGFKLVRQLKKKGV